MRGVTGAEVGLAGLKRRLHGGEAGLAKHGVLSNKGMKLTKLSAAPEHGRPARLVRRCRLMPAPVRSDAGTASQLIPGVGRTKPCA
jgi:hypothetical protein